MSDMTDKTVAGAGRSGAPRWMKITLVVSLALNLLVLGTVLGAAVTGGGKWRDGPRGGPEMSALTRALSDQDRRALKRQMRREFGADRSGRAAFRAEMQGLVEALRSDTFDAADVAARMQRVRGMFGARLETGQQMLVAYWAGMSAEARAAYADRLEAGLMRHPRP